MLGKGAEADAEGSSTTGMNEEYGSYAPEFAGVSIECSETWEFCECLF